MGSDGEAMKKTSVFALKKENKKENRLPVVVDKKYKKLNKEDA